MHEDLERLDQVDQLDRERTRVFRTIEGLRAELVEAEGALIEREAALTEARERVAENRKLQKERQRAVAGHQSNRDAASRLLETGQGDAEAAERQVARTSALIDEVETEILELLEAQDELEAGATEAETARDDALARVEGLRSATPARCDDLEARLAELGGRRDALFAELPSDIRRRYDDWRQRKKWGVARVVGTTCDGCRMEVAAQVRADLLSGRIETCRRCHRWLIPPVQEPSPAAAAPEG